MEVDVKHSKQRNKRRERAQRMQAERDKDAVDGVGIADSADEDSKKPIRPPQRRKKANIFKEPSPILEEDVVDGFAILSFKTYEDLEYAIKLANKRNEKRLSAITELTTIMLEEKLPKIDTGQIKVETTEHGDGRDREREWNYKNNNHHITHINNTANNITFNHDPGTSDDSGRASERLTTSSVAQRDQDSSRDRLSDASSRCSSGKGYICDSEGDDDKASDGGSVVFAANPASTSSPAAAAPRKSDFPITGLPLSNGQLAESPVSAPSKALASLPPPSLPPPPYPTPLQVTNEPHLTSLPNHVGSMQSNGQQPATIPNGKPLAPTSNAKVPSTCTTTSTTASTSPNSKLPVVLTTGTTTPEKVASTGATAKNKKHSPTITNLLAPSSTTAAVTIAGNKETTTIAGITNGLPLLPQPISANVLAIPSPVSSTSSLSSISMPSRLGSSTPPVGGTTVASTVTADNLKNTPSITTTVTDNSTKQTASSLPVPPIPVPAIVMPHPGLDLNPPSPAVTVGPGVLPSQQIQQQQHSAAQIQQQQHSAAQIQQQQIQQQQQMHSAAQMHSAVQQQQMNSAVQQQQQQMQQQMQQQQSLALPHSMNGSGMPPGMPSLISSMGMNAMGGLGPLSHLGASPYGRPMGYPGYSMYSHYGIHHAHHHPHHQFQNPYGLPPSVHSPPTLSPRTVDTRRDSPLVLSSSTSSKPVRPVTPNSNGQTMPPHSSSSALSGGSNNNNNNSNSNSNSSNSSATTTGPSGLRDHQQQQLNPLMSAPGASNPSRGYSPTRDRDSFSNVSSLSRSSATPGSSVIPYSNNTGQPPSGASSLIPYSTAGPPIPSSPIPSSAAPSYPPSPISSLAYPKMTAIVPPQSAWPPMTPSNVNAQNSPSPASSTGSQHRPTPTTPTTPGAPPFGTSPMFTAPLPPPAVPTSSTAPHPFSAESLLNNRAVDKEELRRELDSRFLGRSGLLPPPMPGSSPSAPQQQQQQQDPQPQSQPPSPATTPSAGQTQSTPPGGPPNPQSPFLRQELHHHQHQHTHLHQHQHQHQSLLPTAPNPTLFPPPMFKDIPKIGAADSPFYRTGPAVLGMPPYPYSSGILSHPGLSGSTQFVPPSHLQSFVPKQQGPPAVVDPNKPKQVKTGRWNAMHVRIAWEIYHHQAKQNPDKAAAGTMKPSDMLRPHMYQPPPSPSVRPHEMPQTPPGYPVAPGMPGRGPFDALSANFLGSPSSHLGVSPFGRYGTPFGTSPFTGLSPYARDIPIHDAWRNSLSRVGAYPPPPTALSGTWGAMKPDPGLDAARREAEERDRQMREREERERERQRREREERERQKEREREEKLRREQQEREQRERERERKEKERREMERKEMERERIQQQQRINDSSKAAAAAAAARDRSPLRNGEGDIRVKEEPRKDEEMMMRADPRYHQSIAAWHMANRHQQSHVLPPHMSRGGMLPPSPMVSLSQYSPSAPPGWPPIDPYRDYRFDPMHLRYNPMYDAMRVEEAKAYAAAAAYRNKEPSPVPQQMQMSQQQQQQQGPPTSQSPHHRMPPGQQQLKPPPGHNQMPGLGPPPPSSSSVTSAGLLNSNDMHKKEDPSR